MFGISGVSGLFFKLDSRHSNSLSMENLNKLRHVEAKYKSVHGAPDLILKEEKQVRDLVQEAKDKTAEENSGEWVHVVCGRPEHL